MLMQRDAVPDRPATEPGDAPFPPAALEPRIARLEVRVEDLATQLHELRIDVRNPTQKVDSDVNRLAQEGDQDFRTLLDRIDENLRVLSKRMDQHFSFDLGAFTSLAGLMAKGSHWF